MNENLTDEDLAYLNENLDAVNDYRKYSDSFWNLGTLKPIFKIKRTSYLNLSLVYVYDSNDLLLCVTNWPLMLAYVKEHANN